MGKMASRWKHCWPDKKHWCSSIAHTFMEWDRACWSHRNIILYGKHKDQYKITRLRLKAEAQVWMDAPIVETLIPIQRDWWKRKLLKKAANSDIAFWLVHNKTWRKWVQRKGPEYSSDIDFTWRFSSSTYQIHYKDSKSQIHDAPGWTEGQRTARSSQET